MTLPFATNEDLDSSTISFQLLQRVATGSNQLSNEVDVWVLVLRHKHLLVDSRLAVVSRRLEFRVLLHGHFHKLVLFIFQFPLVPLWKRDWFGF